MAKYLVYISFVLLFTLTGCKPDPLTFKINGIIMDETFNKPLGGGKVELHTFKAGSLFGTLAEINELSEDGKFSFEIERSNFEKIELKVVKENYFSIDHSVMFSDLKSNEENTFDLGITAKSWTEFIIKNQSNPSSNDEFKFLKQSGKTNCSECCSNDYEFYYGHVDTVVVCPNDGNSYMHFYYWVNGNQMHGKDSVFNEPFKTITYEFIY